MVKVPGAEIDPGLKVADYLIDRFEVTNKQFKEFVDSGGYTRPDYWKVEFIDNGRSVPRTEAMARFRDRTGRPGPSTWELGDYPEGQADYPVTGVSWYEAAAYAEFARKSLPTVHHWRNAAGAWYNPPIVPLSNFGGRGLARGGAYQGMGPYGTYDMAGNAREWCWNAATPGTRYILGGAWNEPAYMFGEADAEQSFDRSPLNGFRCARYPTAQPAAAMKPIPPEAGQRDLTKAKPVPDAIFKVYRSLYGYDNTPLETATQSVDDADRRWRKEKVSFKAAYGNERVSANLYLPKQSRPPFQTVIYFPGAYALQLRSNQNLDLDLFFDFIVKSGRALVYPIYKGTYERWDAYSTAAAPSPRVFRDHVIQWSQDLGRTIDYVQTRKDLRHDAIAYYGLSWGADLGALLPALDERIKVLVLVGGGLDRSIGVPPEVDPVNFAPRIRAPVLMINGRYDFFLPLELSQTPMLRLFGAAEADKRHALADSGHFPPKNFMMKEALDWLDRYLGATQ
jgi:cephalosporin-C deacetylase-like acetyl esterase